MHDDCVHPNVVIDQDNLALMDDTNENLDEELRLDSHEQEVEVKVFKLEALQSQVVLNLQKRHQFLRLEVVHEVELQVTGITFQVVKHQRKIKLKRILLKLGVRLSAHQEVVYPRNDHSGVDELQDLTQDFESWLV